MSLSSKPNTSKLSQKDTPKPNSKENWLRSSGLITSVDLGLRSLEPRILLDAAGFVTGAEVAVDAMQADDVSQTMEATFSGEAGAVDSAVMENEALLSALEAETEEADDNAIEKDFTGVVSQPIKETLVDDGPFEIHSGETINVDLRANDSGNGQLVGIIDPAQPDVVITLTNNEPVELASGLGVELLEDGTFNVTGPSNPTERFVSFDYVVQDATGETQQATATFDWPVAPTIDLDVADTTTTNTTVFFDPAASNPVRLASDDAVGIDLDGEEIVSLTLNFSGFTEANQESLLILNSNDSVNSTFQFQPTAGAFPQGFFFEGVQYTATIDSMNGVHSFMRQDGAAMSTGEVSALIRAIAYDNNDSNISAARTVIFTLNDGTFDSNAASATIIFESAGLADPTAPTIDLDVLDDPSVEPNEAAGIIPLNISEPINIVTDADGNTVEATYSSVAIVNGVTIDLVATLDNLEIIEESTSNNPVTEFTFNTCLLYTSPSPRDKRQSRMPSSA